MCLKLKIALNFVVKYSEIRYIKYVASKWRIFHKKIT